MNLEDLPEFSLAQPVELLSFDQLCFPGGQKCVAPADIGIFLRFKDWL